MLCVWCCVGGDAIRGIKLSSLTGPELTNSKSRILRRASDGYRLEPMPPSPGGSEPRRRRGGSLVKTAECGCTVRPARPTRRVWAGWCAPGRLHICCEIEAL